MSTMKVSKLDAARRQLDTAIRLYFSNADVVSIHTLAAAAYNIIHDVSKKRGAAAMLVKGSLIEDARAEVRDKLRVEFNKAENFFKHADRDPDGVHDFWSGLSELFLLDACDQYYRLTGETTPFFHLYRSWFIANHPDFFDAEKLGRVKDAAPEFAALGRSEFMRQFLPLISLL